MDRKGLELSVGLFLLIGLLCLGYVSFHLGKIHFFGASDYQVHATFSNVGGLKTDADVTMAGVRIGRVESIRLKEGLAMITLSIHKDIQLEEDVIASVKTSGIIGDKYIAVSPGASDIFIKSGGTIMETQPPLDIEHLVGKFVFGSMERAAQPEKTEKNKTEAAPSAPPEEMPAKADPPPAVD